MKKKTSRSTWLKIIFQNALLGSWILDEEHGGNVVSLTKQQGFGGQQIGLGKAVVSTETLMRAL